MADPAPPTPPSPTADKFPHPDRRRDRPGDRRPLLRPRYFRSLRLAILLSFALTPLVNWLRRWRLPRIAAVLVAVTLAFVLIAGIAFVVGRQLVQLANNLPSLPDHHH